MFIIDGHCDTVTKIMEEGGNLLKNPFHLDIERLRNIGDYVQFFAAFVDAANCKTNPLMNAIQIIDRFNLELEINKDVMMLCRNYNDIIIALKSSKVAAFLSIEGGEALQGDISALRTFYRLGVRSLCLTWNHRNEIADGVSERISGGGLTTFGRTVIKEMNSLGMLVDISHISERGFWDVSEISTSPIIASHSNVKRLCSHARNLTDEQILAIKNSGGIIGVNFYPYFLNDSGKASIKEVISHIEYIMAVAGCGCIGIGSDFDGIECTPEGLKDVQHIHCIFDELLKLNYPEECVEGIAGKNFLRVIKQVCR